MNFYFKFFNKEKSEYVKVNSNTDSVKTNMDKFDLKIFNQEVPIDMNVITEVTLVIEKENKGSFFHYKSVSGITDIYEKTINFNNMFLLSEDISAIFRIYLEFKENGITTYNTKDNYRKIYLKQKSEDFDIDVHNAKRIDNVFELQNSEEEDITFDINLFSNEETNTNKYRFWINHEENSKIEKEFEPLGTNIRTFTSKKLNTMFNNNETFIHFELIDVFRNIRYKRYKLLAPGNTFSLFEIFNEVININDFTTPIKLFIDYRNAKLITPVIEYYLNKTKKRIVSEKQIGEALYNKNTLDFKLSDYFLVDTILKETNKLELFFLINNNEKSTSSIVPISFDNKKPIIKLSNLDEENYRLIVDDVQSTQINGMVFDESLFYIGSENKRCTFDNISNKLLLTSSKKLKKIVFEGNKETYLYRYGEYYLAEDKGIDFKIYDESNQIVDSKFYTYLDNRVDEENKKFFIILDRNKLSNYEKNIIENQNGLKIKGPLSNELISQKFIKFSNYYIVEGVISKTKKLAYTFSLGINDFEYDFSKYIYDTNISCKLSKYKEAVLDFDRTQFIFIANNKQTTLVTFDNSTKLKEIRTNKLEDISFAILSKKDSEYFTPLESVTFIDQFLNSIPYEKIHLLPKVKNNKEQEIKINNFSMAEIINNNEEKSYNISMDIPIENGENLYTLEISDNTGLTEKTNFIIEKNTNPIRADIQELDMNDSEIFRKDNTIYLTNNKDLCFVKVIIFNETRKQKKYEKYINVKNGLTIEKHRVQTYQGTRFVALYLNNKSEETEYSITYDNDNEELLKIVTKKQNGLFLKLENDFIVGNNTYHLNYEKDQFSTITIEYTNRQNFRCEVFDKYIEIQRIKNTNFIEDIQITVTVNDKNANYSHVTKTATGKFYNETIVSDYYIEKANNTAGKIDEPTFDLIVKSQDVANIKYIAIYDDSELNVFNRKKIAYFDNEKNYFRFNSITTPITPSTIKLFFYINTNENLILEKEIFVDQKIYYSRDRNKVLVSASETKDEIQLVFNTSETRDIYKKIEVFANDNLILCKNNIEIDTVASHCENIKIIDLPLDVNIYARITDKKGIVSYSKVFNFDFNIKNTDVSISHNFNRKLIDVESANTIVLGSYQDKIIELVTIDNYGVKSTYQLKNGVQNVNAFKAGMIYKVYMYLKDRNARKQFFYNIIQVYSEIEDILELRNRFFEKIKLNNTVSIKNNSIFDGYDLNCYMSQFVDGAFIKTYSPIYRENNIEFKFNKYKGINKLIFHYNNEQIMLSEFNYVIKPVFEQSIYDIKVDKNIISSYENNELILTEKAEVSLKTKGLRKVLIKSESLGREIIKTVADNFTCRINKVWIPCTIIGYDENDNLSYVKPISIKSLQINRFSFKLGDRRKNIERGVRMRYSLTASMPVFKRNSFNFKIDTYKYHPFLNFGDNYARSIGKVAWFKFDKISRNNIIKDITNGLITETDLIKEKIINYIGGL